LLKLTSLFTSNSIIIHTVVQNICHVITRRIQVQYGSVLATTHGGANGLVGSFQVISLADSETITAMTLNSAAAQGTSTVCICYILIETSAGKSYGPYDAGCGAATATRYTLDGGLAYIDGRSGNELDGLTLNYWTSASCGEETRKRNT
jgi:hypothetical protein